jgi:hypothetical protein
MLIALFLLLFKKFLKTHLPINNNYYIIINIVHMQIIPAAELQFGKINNNL